MIASAYCAQVISIHAPAKGATNDMILPCIPKLDFNPRSREGSDSFYYGNNTQIEQFQSTLPRRERLLCDFTSLCVCHFNPRSREGSDDDVVCAFEDFEISIHAPAKGATRARIQSNAHTKNFNPRSREGSDDKLYASAGQFEISIHAPAKGATCRDMRYISTARRFQSTLPRRERRRPECPGQM